MKCFHLKILGKWGDEMKGTEKSQILNTCQMYVDDLENVPETLFPLF